MKQPWKQESRRIVAGHTMTDKAFRWLGERLTDRVHAAKGWSDNTWPFELREHVVAWYLEHRLRFVDWRAYSDFANHQASTGRWVLCEADFTESFHEALTDAHRRIEAARYPTIDAWLEAERKGLLQSWGAAGGSASFSPEVVAQLKDAKERRAWSARTCRDCGDRFRVDYRFSRVVRCEGCRTAKRKQLPSRTRSSISPVQPQKLLPASTSKTASEEYLRGRQDQEEQFLRRLATESPDATLKAIAGMNLLIKDLLQKERDQ